MVLFDHHPHPQCLLEVIGKDKYVFKAVNKAYLKSLAVVDPTITEDQLVDKELEEVVLQVMKFPRKIYDNSLIHYRKAIDEEDTCQFREKFYFDATEYTYISSGTPVLDQGKCRWLIYHTYDATERIKEENALLESEKKFRALIENASEGIILYSKYGIIRYVSPSVKKLGGYEAHDLIGNGGMGFIYPDDQAKTLQKFQESVDNPGATIVFYHRIMRKDKSFFWSESTLTNLLHEPEVNGIISNFRDITEKKEAGDKIRRNERIISSINQNIELGIYRSIPDQSFEYVNNAFLRMFGFDSLEDLNKVEPSSLYKDQGKRNEVKFLLDRNRYISNEEAQFVRKNGETFWGMLSSTATTDENGQVFFDGAVRDITYQKLAEEKMKLLNEELVLQNYKLEKSEIELKEALKELSNRNFELDQLVYRTSHDLKSPLDSILGLVNIAKMENNHENTIDYFSRIEKQIIKLNDFIHSTITYAKSSRMEVENEAIDFNALVKDSLKDLKYLENFDKVKTRIKVSGKKISFHGDKMRTKTILSNIFSNAYKYMDPRKGEGRLEVMVDISMDGAEIRISDNGIGISKENQEKIFNMFFRATEISEGSGLGMYIVKQSVEKLDGTISLESKEGDGTTIFIYLPNQAPEKRSDG